MRTYEMINHGPWLPVLMLGLGAFGLGLLVWMLLRRDRGPQPTGEVYEPKNDSDAPF